MQACLSGEKISTCIKVGLTEDELYDIEENVAAEDKIRMQQAMDFQNVCERLTRNPQFIIHYRVRRDGMIHYYYVKCARIGEAGSFTDIVFAFANEDMDVQHSEMESILEPGGTASRRKLLIIEDNELNRKLLAELLEDSFDVMTAVPIELTETAALYNMQIKELTEKMVEAGFELHMDDFGSGYSSMTSLNQLPFDTLKLDKSLIDYIENPRGREVIRHTISLAHSLGMQVLAEGVEKADQVDIAIRI